MRGTQQTRVIAIVDDMFFASKIRQAAKTTEVDLEILKKPDGIIEEITKTVPALIIVDLASRKFNALELIQELKTREDLREVPTLGYLPHVEDDLKKQAMKSGYDVVMPRSRFSREMVSILEKYVVEN